MQSPDNIGGVFDIARFLETLERNRVDIVSAIETADYDESSIGVALKFFKLSNRIINAEFSRLARSGNNLEVIKADDRSFSFIAAKRIEQGKQFVDRFVLEFKNA